MIDANITGCLALAFGGFALSAVCVRQLTKRTIRRSTSNDEPGGPVSGPALLAPSAQAHSFDPSAVPAAVAAIYAQAIGRLAAAIEKHAEAIDDLGAATVAAAVESHALPFAVGTLNYDTKPQ
jgi:hypothetical protein